MSQRIRVLVIVLISMGAGAIIVPAIQRTRHFYLEHQGMCKYMQIGLAMQNYDTTRKHFPRGTIPNPDVRSDRRLSWFVEILPYVEQSTVHDRIDMGKAWDAPENREGVETRIETFLCAANPNQPSVDLPAPTHYVGLAGIGEDAPELPANHHRAGMFGYDRTIRLGNITDGSSNTIWGIGTASMNGPWAAGGPATVRPVVPSLKPYLGENRPFGGIHKGVARVGMVDGSVRQITDSIKPSVFEALVTIAGEEGSSMEW